MVKKYILIISLFLILLLPGCSNEKTGYSYHPTYIDSNNGKRWLNYAILYENTHTGIKDGTLSILKQEEHTQEYQLFFSVDSSYYQKGDIILGTSNYIYFFNQDEEKTFRIVGFKLSSEKETPVIIDNKKIKSTVNVYGANKENIYVSYFDGNKEIYLKISADLNKIYEVDSLENIKNQIEYNILKNKY
ncbi:MAG: hypothetical protein IJ565_06130 [Bacilli bacterium]|nr:hypothetical protein [Bacilli bacterium]